MAHSFMQQRILAQDDAAASKIRAAGIRGRFVGTCRRCDVPDASTEAEVARSVESEMLRVAAEPSRR